ncbi:iron ABC transporter permease [Nocardia sp. CDC159]|uniref:Iron ABC transporter permease n=1 Tax=Nocardia pulmonis TaxID=2951408 RepID=A0A9X2IV09_9NOCA|nr:MULTISPECIES: iron ABC transporter permease [Nocardia]MCM6771954.1 iron ABC transporter permease [Nocardia pulmonis]MCM6785388.1 iron ABC transporter permease [Nocardia sp. CDC159]
MTAPTILAAQQLSATRGTRRRRVGGVLVLLALLAGGVVASLAIGAHWLPPGQLAAALSERFVTDPATIAAMSPDRAARNDAALTVQSLRLPRTLIAIVAGAALGTAGALIQGHTRNPIADPGLLGVNAGAAFAMVTAISVLGLGAPIQYVWFALAGAAIAAVIVFGLSGIGTGAMSPLTLILVGSGISVFLGALTSVTILSDSAALNVNRYWNTGSIAGRGYSGLWTTAPLMIGGMAVAFAHARRINVLNLGDDIARALGTNVIRARLVGVLTLTALAGGATAACGAIAFLGLIAPHIARRVTGPDYRWLVPCAALVGAVLTVYADTAGRIVARPGEIPVGIMLSLIGAPCFVALALARRMVRI